MTMPHVAHKPPDGTHSPRFRVPVLFWMIVAAVLLTGVTVALSLWIPRLQYQRSISRIQQKGGTVYSEPARSIDVSRWLSGRNRRILAIDLSAAELSDEDVAGLSEFDDLRRLLIAGPRLTDSALEHLRSLENLESLVLVNCPRISKRGEQKLKAKLSKLQISHRGAALLGIVGAPHRFGCQIQSVRPGTAAAKAGLIPRDVITHFDGRRVRNTNVDGRSIGGFEALTRLIARRSPGDRVPIVAYRRGRRLELFAVLGKWQAGGTTN